MAKVQLGDKATITFSAIPGLSLTGEVTQIDSVGTVSQGVVTYNVQMSFDTQDPRVKPGMSISAAIITNLDQNVLLVPNSAIKTQGGTTYVQMFASPLPAPVAGQQGSPSSTPPIQKMVTVGISNTTSTEITSGLNAGDEVVVKTITAGSTTKTTAATATPSLFGSGTTGGRGGLTGGTRIP